MQKVRDILALPEPERTKGLEALDNTDVIYFTSDKAFPVRFENKIKQVVKGKNAAPKAFGIWMLRKYPDLVEVNPDETIKTTDGKPHSVYAEKLIAIKGIAEASADKIVAEFPTPAELVEAAKADRLGDWDKFKDAILEVFK